MNRTLTLTGFSLSFFLAAAAPLSARGNEAAVHWSPKAAAGYLDTRLDWWTTWPKSARDHETFCISCHTAVPYAVSRHALRAPLGESGLTKPERTMVANVEKRVSIWETAEPFYNDKGSGPNKSYESRGTEAVLNTLVLLMESETGAPSKLAAQAFDNMWKQQITEGDRRGSFPWLDFHNRPWEADDSPYYGASLAAIAAGSAPSAWLGREDVKPQVEALRGYLQREFTKQSLINRSVALWADSLLHGILTAQQKSALAEELFRVQQADGGWSLTSVAGTWKRRDDTKLETRSDGYATGLIVWALERSGTQKKSPGVKRALAWLDTNQSSSDGLWPAWSLNKERDPASEVGRFMTDAATAYSVLALTAR